MTWTLELWVEGPTDATETAEGVLPSLTHRTLRERSGLRAGAYERAVATNVRVKPLKDRLRGTVAFSGARARGLSGWAGKAVVALADARVRDPSAIILLVRDCDGDPQRLVERDRANNAMHNHGDFGHAVAVCVQAVEAWLLADPRAFRQCFGRGPERGIPGDPESVSDPKSLLRDLIAGLESRQDCDRWSAIYARLANEVDLDTLAEECVRGYATFQQDVDRLIVPLLKA